MKRIALTTGILAFASAAHAQSATIRGIVRDSSMQPVARAEVSLDPTSRRIRTDSTGRFVFDSLDGGQFVVRARRLGFNPAEWTVDLSKSGKIDVQLVLGPRIAMLDTVFARDGAPCEPQEYQGFMCRRALAKGRFIDYTDIDSMNVLYSADLLRDIGGFTSVVRSTSIGPTRQAASRHCTVVLVNGVATPWGGVPESAYDIIGIEIYQTPQDIPKEYRRYTWGKEDCWLVAYWTANYLRPVKKAALPPPNEIANTPRAPFPSSPSPRKER
jgi:hypothetical protein